MNDNRLYGTLPPGAAPARFKHKANKSLRPAKRPPSPPRAAPTSTTGSTTVNSLIGSKRIDVTKPNKLLAGYMAHEFRTKGTVLGKKLDAARADTSTTPSNGGDESYKEITGLLMMKTDSGDHNHIPGIVNPSQLVHWIQM